MSGSDLFVTSHLAGTVVEYTTSVPTENETFITGLNPTGIAVSGSDLCVAKRTGAVGEYTTSGVTVNASLITGLGDGWGIAVATVVPEPPSVVLFGLGLLACAGRASSSATHCRRHAAAG